MAGGSIFKPSISNSQRIISFFPPNLLSSHGHSKKNSSLLVRASSQVFSSIGLDLSLSVGVHQIPHPNKVDRGGEDALFISSYNGGVIGVADGVSGWAEKNVDPALFSRELMANASSFVEDNEVNYDPQILLMKAHAATMSIGSATVIVAMMEKTGTLKIANIGDCGIRIIRKGKLIFSSCPVEHYFDCPYQMSSEPVTQTYLDAVVSSVKLLEGDVIVMGSDGLFDNVFDHEILSSVTNQNDVNETAKVIARLANGHSKDTNFDSPYTIEARSRGIDVEDWKKLLGMKLTGNYRNYNVKAAQKLCDTCSEKLRSNIIFWQVGSSMILLYLSLRLSRTQCESSDLTGGDDSPFMVVFVLGVQGVGSLFAFQ